MNICSSLQILLISLLSLSSLCCCKSNASQSDTKKGKPVNIEYARNLQMEEHDGYTIVKLSDPWHSGKVLQNYILVDKDADLPTDLPEGIVVRTPLNKVVLGSSVHAALMTELGVDSAIAGMCDVEYLNLPDIKGKVNSGSVRNCGSSMSPNIEAIMDLQPDALLLSPYETSGNFGKVGNLGIPIIQLADYMEAGPLARAEWIKFYSRLFGSVEKGDSIFSDSKNRYNDLKSKAASSTKAGNVLTNKMMESTWYVPAGQSTIGLLIADTNASYPWSDTNQEGAIALPYESVLDKAGDAPLWIISYNSTTPLTYSGLLTENPRYRQFRAFKDRNIYGCNTNGSLYYEETPFHPERLLRDLIIITHPGLIEGQTVYFKPLDE